MERRVQREAGADFQRPQSWSLGKGPSRSNSKKSSIDLSSIEPSVYDAENGTLGSAVMPVNCVDAIGSCMV